jgi:cobalt-zinc-cadmium efflux system outer membrane protein
MQSAGYEKQQVRLQLLQGLNVAYTRMASFHDMATALKDDALPKARQAFALTRQAYQQGDVQYIDVIDAQKTLNGLQAQYLEALSEYHMAVAWIESMICKPLIQLGDSVEPVKP